MNIETWKCGPPPSTGQKQRYPSRFIDNVRRYYPDFLSTNTLHLFSGSSDFGITTDIRADTGCDIIAPFDDIPLENGSVDNALADPPYADFFMRDWDNDCLLYTSDAADE